MSTLYIVTAFHRDDYCLKGSAVDKVARVCELEEELVDFDRRQPIRGYHFTRSQHQRDQEKDR